MLKRIKKGDPDPVLIGCAKLSKIQGPKTLHQIARACNCSPALIQKIQNRAIKKLRYDPMMIMETEGRGRNEGRGRKVVKENGGRAVELTIQSKIASLRLRGDSLRKIAKDLKLSVSTVHKYLPKHQTTLRRIKELKQHLA